jgi:hypothetical protein
VFVNGLALIVIFGIQLPISAGNRLRGLIGFEAQIANLMIVRLSFIPQAPVTEHEIVVGLQVFRINGESRIKLLDRIAILPFKEENTPEFVAYDTIPRILSGRLSQVLCGFVIFTLRPEYAGVEEVGAGQIRCDGKRLLQDNPGAFHVPFLYGGTANIYPSIWIRGLDLGDLLKRLLGAIRIALRQ